MHARQLFGILGILVLAGCQPGGGGGATLFQPSAQGQGSAGPESAIVDVAAMVTVPASRQPRLRYNETDAFDRIMHSSMKGLTSAITVNADEVQVSKAQLETAGAFTADTPRIYRWIWKVRDTGGRSIACDEPRTRFLGGVVMMGLKMVAGMIRDYVTYGPAEKYHARAFFNPNDDLLIRVEFIRRDLISDLDCDTPMPGA